MENLTASEKARVLMEALPYIKKFHGRTVVIKYGGKAMVDDQLKDSVMTDIALLVLVGIRVVIVHGGGPQISQLLEKLNMKVSFIDGIRVTDAQTMEVVRMVLTGKVNRELVQLLNLHGIRAIGLSGEDGNLIMAEQISPELGYAGRAVRVNSDMLVSLIDSGYVPVIATTGVDEQGNAYNVNADNAAELVARSIKAHKLIFLTDVDGIRVDGKLVSSIDVGEARDLINAEKVTEGMKQKLLACLNAVEGGVESAHILNGTIDHALLLEIFTDSGIGTMIRRTTR